MYHFDENETLFLAGIKPALLLNVAEKNCEYFAKEFPYSHFTYRTFNATEFVTVAVFFQTFQQKLLFDMKRLFYKGKYFDQLLGITLGFPPNAIKQYLKNEDCEDLYDVGVVYHGIYFKTNLMTLQQDIEWLEDRYQIPNTLQTEITIRLHKKLSKERVKINSIENIQEQIVEHFQKQIQLL